VVQGFQAGNRVVSGGRDTQHDSARRLYSDRVHWFTGRFSSRVKIADLSYEIFQFYL
jgi:hypothetical protein